MEIYVVKSLTEYIKLIDKVGSTDTEKWYRGQNGSEYRLTPSALREIYAIADPMGNAIKPPHKDNVCSGSNCEVAFCQ